MEHQKASEQGAEIVCVNSRTLAQRQQDIQRFIDAMKHMTLNEYQDEVVWARQPTENDVLRDLGEELFRLTAKVTGAGFTLERVARFNLASRRPTPIFSPSEDKPSFGGDVINGGANG